jgi:hypothetical protein
MGNRLEAFKQGLYTLCQKHRVTLQSDDDVRVVDQADVARTVRTLNVAAAVNGLGSAGELAPLKDAGAKSV